MFGEVDDESHEQTFLFSSTARSERINFISIRCSINRLHDSTREILPTTTRTLTSDEPPPPTDKNGRKQQRGRASTLTSLYVSSMIEEVFTADANAMYLQGCLTLLQIETLTCNHRQSNDRKDDDDDTPLRVSSLSSEPSTRRRTSSNVSS